MNIKLDFLFEMKVHVKCNSLQFYLIYPRSKIEMHPDACISSRKNFIGYHIILEAISFVNEMLKTIVGSHGSRDMMI